MRRRALAMCAGWGGDYFPNFILPSNDTLFDDLDLDACQMFDFVKQSTKLSEAQLDMELTTVINYLESKHEATSPMMITTPSTISQERREFTSLLNELLEDTTASLELTTTSMPSITSTIMTRKPFNISTVATALEPSSTTYAITTTKAPTTLSTTALKTSKANRHTTTSTSTAAAETSISTDLTYSDGDEYDETGPDDVPVDSLLKGMEDREDDGGLRSPSAQEPTPSSPFLKGGVVIKKIHSWNDVNPSVEYGPYDDDDINDDNAVDMDVVVPVESAAKHPSRNTSIVHDSAKGAADRETLVLIYSLLLAISVFTLMCILICFVWCRKTGHATITKPLY
ncbi:hypothetical protein TELCIR_14540 [Teladorsagia circumcincta]|uniref:Uncharacterized protein n=1 Tax=Teladorsagia circumcincta TaxID=45464 RepID=A0A2G9U0V9_TELCI|nr:hypothetical protein TELCIR_14540 [Teladorsagia circumcincta]